MSVAETGTRAHPGLNLHGTDPGTHEAAEPVIFGFWIFLMSDLILFALLFATYAAASRQGLGSGPGPDALFTLGPPLLQTLVLLTSSFTFGLASLALKYREGARGVALWMAASGLLGLVFLGLEIADFRHLARDLGAPPQRSGFLSAYFLLLGMHGAHLVAALLWMAVMFAQLAVFGLVGEVKLRLMRLALFWHMLDVVWVGIFSFVFLAGVSP